LRAKRSNPGFGFTGLLRRFAPRNDDGLHDYALDLLNETAPSLVIAFLGDFIDFTQQLRAKSGFDDIGKGLF